MKTALLSVTDKVGIVMFARGLERHGFRIVSTGGTAKLLRDEGLTVTDVAELTAFPEMLDGRVKTLHPAIHAGILADLNCDEHRVALREREIEPIELVCVNLYAFEKTVSGPHTLDEAIESIDIGGPAMIRSAAKNHANSLVVVDPSDYERVLVELTTGLTQEMRLKMAAKAFRHTAFYDSMIGCYLTEHAGVERKTETLTVGMRWDGIDLRYGENSHQTARRYLDPLQSSRALKLAGGDTSKAISYNNWLDAEAAWELACDLPVGACAIIKHGNPCGAAVGRDLGESYRLARASDPISAFGGIVAFHGTIDEEAVAAMTEKGNFLEVVVGIGDISPDLVELVQSGPAWGANVRFLVGELPSGAPPLTVHSVRGGFLVQDADEDPGESEWKVSTDRGPTDDEWAALRFVWAVVPHVKSNAIVVGNSNRLFGVGAGQMNRVQSVRLALDQAGDLANGAALASDAFFPFPDSIEKAAEAGIRAIIQPGGSKKDNAVLEVANKFGIAMVMTGTRHFRHC